VDAAAARRGLGSRGGGNPRCPRSPARKKQRAEAKAALHAPLEARIAELRAGPKCHFTTLLIASLEFELREIG
jgi:hypothetical protein